jgi:glutamine synthetase
MYRGMNAEVKSFDNTANPYIGLAAIVAAGMLGLLLVCPLPQPLQVG